MEPDARTTRHYEVKNEDARLWAPGLGDLVRLRTWDLFRRHLPPPPAVVLDVGGGPGTHARHLADRGYAVTLIDPVARHVGTARARGAAPPPFSVRLADARSLPVAGASVDAVVLLGPLYHLVDPGDRAVALAE